MESYILLRNNKEYGPFTLKELKSFGINTTDLIWVEGESDSWKHPSEISGLKVMAQSGLKPPIPDALKAHRKINTPSYVYSNSSSQKNESQNAAYFPDNVSIYTSKKYRNKKQINKVNISGSFFGFLFLMIVVGFCAFIVKRMVGGFNEEAFSPTAEAKTIKEEILHPSSTAHSARITNAHTTAQTISSASAIKKDTAQQKIEEAKTVVVNKISKRKVVSSTLVDNNNSDKNNALIIAEVKDEAVEKPLVEISQQANPPPSLQVSANDYSVGMLGGISNLELSITNPSSQSIEKATVEVEFLKPNGKVVKSQMVSVENIAPGSSKKIAVPSSNRGVKIRYMVVNMQAEAKQ